MRSSNLISFLVVGLLLAALHSTSVSAEIRIQGPIENIRLDVREATVAEILTALHDRFHLTFHGATANHRVTATFQGSLRGVLTRVLDGYDYVIKSSATNIDVTVLSVGSPREAVPVPLVHRRSD